MPRRRTGGGDRHSRGHEVTNAGKAYSTPSAGTTYTSSAGLTYTTSAGLTYRRNAAEISAVGFLWGKL
jgi:hypothetical protein